MRPAAVHAGDVLRALLDRCSRLPIAAMSGTGITVVEPSDEPNPGSGERDLHDLFREVARRMPHALIRGGDVDTTPCSRTCRSAIAVIRPSPASSSRGSSDRPLASMMTCGSSTIISNRSVSIGKAERPLEVAEHGDEVRRPARGW